MKMPDICPECKTKMVYWIQRSEPDYDSDDPDRIVDSIEECNKCHTLFRFRWKLDSITKLMEEPIIVSTKQREPVNIEDLGLTEKDVEDFGRMFLKNVNELAEIDDSEFNQKDDKEVNI